MRGKRAKQYRKLMQQYGLTFGFREPYQVLVDAQMIEDAERFKMDLVGGLERTLSGKVKPMITQCSIRHLYSLASPTISPPIKDALISLAKTMERRRCNHHELDDPLPTLECLSSVIDPKASGTNKNRYVVASQTADVRRYCRGLKGVPLVYVKRSVMIMEPMSEGSVGVRESEEKEKFRQGLRGRVAGLGKRSREDDKAVDGQAPAEEAGGSAIGREQIAKKKRTRGPKGPNPLSVKKSKGEIKIKDANKDVEGQRVTMVETTDTVEDEVKGNVVTDGHMDDSILSKRKKKRQRPRNKKKEILVSDDGGGSEEES